MMMMMIIIIIIIIIYGNSIGLIRNHGFMMYGQV